jgi:hypothetical protein
MLCYTTWSACTSHDGIVRHGISLQRDTRHSDKGPLKSRHPAVQPERVIRYKCAHGACKHACMIQQQMNTPRLRMGRLTLHAPPRHGPLDLSPATAQSCHSSSRTERGGSWVQHAQAQRVPAGSGSRCTGTSWGSSCSTPARRTASTTSWCWTSATCVSGCSPQWRRTTSALSRCLACGAASSECARCCVPAGGSWQSHAHRSMVSV